MKTLAVPALAAALALAGCGVKSDLERPGAPPQKSDASKPSPKSDNDPSKPPSQLGK